MGMGLGEHLKVTLFGESHGKCVGALFEGIPPGTEIDLDCSCERLISQKTWKKRNVSQIGDRRMRDSVRSA